MNYNEFINYIKDKVSLILGEKYDVSLTSVLKNNGLYLDGLLIKSDNFKLTPNLYLNEKYDLYINGKDIDEICDELVHQYRCLDKSSLYELCDFSDFNKVKDKIILRLINTEKNKELLETAPHMDFLDLSILFYIDIKSNSYESAVTLIKNQIIDIWKVDVSELYSVAIDNTARLRYPLFGNLFEIYKDYYKKCNLSFQKMLSEDISVFDSEINMEPTLYVITNSLLCFGATCILYKDLLKQIAERLDDDLCIIPSSVHEVIIFAARDMQVDDINEFIEHVNATALAKDEILSNHLYYYSKDLNMIKIY